MCDIIFYMKIHSVRITIQDVYTSDDVPVVAGFTDIFIDQGEKMVSEDGEEQPKYKKLSSTFLLGKNPKFKQEIQKMVIETITLHDLEEKKKNGEELSLPDDLGLGLVKKKSKGKVRHTKSKK